jgi:5-methylcytosine-specific restriction endonuclease McrA
MKGIVEMSKKKLKKIELNGRKKYSVLEILPKILSNKKWENPRERPEVIIDGDHIGMDSQRYKVFAKSTKCVTCGIDGTIFLKDIGGTKEGDKKHFNLYAEDTNGDLILMTKDHIIPKSRGGKNQINNYQTMCSRCNFEKGNKLEEERQLNK